MKKINITFSLLLICTGLFAQMELPDLNQVKKIVVMNYWGDQHIQGVEPGAGKFTLAAKYTETKSLHLDSRAELEGYVTVRRFGDVLYITARKPKGFESIDLFIHIPADIMVSSELFIGGNIFMNNLNGGVEVNSLNGSVRLEKIGGYALVSAANGEVNAQFQEVDTSKAISLITLNGGVSVSLPKSASRDVRLISRKNGYINSDFSLQSDIPIKNLNAKVYSKDPIVHTAQINGGGSLLFLSTQNGPISLKTWN